MIPTIDNAGNNHVYHRDAINMDNICILHRKERVTLDKRETNTAITMISSCTEVMP